MRSLEDMPPPPRKGEPFTDYLVRVTAIRRPYRPENPTDPEADVPDGTLDPRSTEGGA